MKRLFTAVFCLLLLAFVSSSGARMGVLIVGGGGGGGGGGGCTSSTDTKIVDSGNAADAAVWADTRRAYQFTIGTQKSVTGIWLAVNDSGSARTLTCEVWTDVSNVPGAIYGAGFTGSITDIADSGYTEHEVLFAATQILPSGTYWATCLSTGGVSYGYQTSGGSGTFMYYSGSWQSSSYKLEIGVMGCD